MLAIFLTNEDSSGSALLSS